MLQRSFLAPLLLAATGSMAGSQSITRVVSVRDQDQQSANYSFAGTSGESIPSLWIQSLADFQSTGLPPGVELAQIHVEGATSVSIEIGFRGLAPLGTTISGYHRIGEGACGGGCDWGIRDFVTRGADLRIDTPFAPGELATFSHTETFPGFETIRPGDSDWALAMAAPVHDFELIIDLQFDAESGGLPTVVDVESVDLAVASWIQIAAAYELAVAPSSVYCGSAANSTGGSALLEAYGSLEAGTEWLTIGGTGYPEGSAAILFSGSTFASSPGIGTVTLCVGGQLRRMGGIQFAEGGALQFDVDLVGVSPGESVYFQSIHRDPSLGVAASSGTIVVAQ